MLGPRAFWFRFRRVDLDRVVRVYLWSVDLRRETARKFTNEEV